MLSLIATSSGFHSLLGSPLRAPPHCAAASQLAAARAAPSLRTPPLLARVGAPRACADSPISYEAVEAAVEKAEALWAEALAARELADRLAGEAEELSTTAGDASEEAAKALDGSSTFSLSLLSGAQSAQSSSLDAGRALADAYDAAEEAVKKEAVAEAALEASEALIEQYENEGGGLSPID